MADNFANNAFSDFAPLLTLFGDEVTKQYLATSVGIADSILLGIAPIGLMTIIVSSIRVGGNRFMKAVIGRARDSPDDEEKEMLSSTSANVREIWNGSRIVRQTGPAKTAQLVFGPGRLISYRSHPPRSAKRPAGVLQRLEQTNYSYQGIGMFFTRRSRLRPMSLSNNVPPSLTLNVQNAIPNQWTVLAFAFFGALIQVFAMIFNAVVVYYWRWSRGGNAVASYGYPTWAVGTASISLGASICGWVLESSSWKFNLQTLDDGAQIVLFQKKLPDQQIQAYAIRPIKADGKFKVSQRGWPPVRGDETKGRKSERQLREVSTAVGTILALSGFICQNIGTRELHWSAGVLQLGVTLILTLIRAWLRRRVGDVPHLDGQKAILALEDGFEACHLVTTVLTRQCCFLLTSYVPMMHETSDGHQLLADIKLLGSSTNDSLSVSNNWNIVRSALESQAFLEEIEPSSDLAQVQERATGCHGAMEEILFEICKAAGEEDVVFLTEMRDLFFLVTMDADLLSASNSGSTSSMPSAIVSTDFQDIFHPLDRIAYLQAIISFTIYAHRSKSDFSRQELSTMYRILGHCDRVDVDGYIAILRAWNALPRHRMFEPKPVKYIALAGSAPNAGGKYELPGPLDQGSIVFGRPFSQCRRSPLGSLEPPHSKICNLVVQDYESYASGHDNFRSRLLQNIIIELFTSFFLRLTEENPALIKKFLASKPTPDVACDRLADILMNHGVCKSRQQAMLAIVPALVLSRQLSVWPKEFEPPRPPIINPEDRENKENGKERADEGEKADRGKRFAWNHKTVFFEWADLEESLLVDEEGQARELPKGSREEDYSDQYPYRGYGEDI